MPPKRVIHKGAEVSQVLYNNVRRSIRPWPFRVRFGLYPFPKKYSIRSGIWLSNDEDWHDKEVHRCHLVGVIAKKSGPALTRWMGCSHHIGRHRCFAHIETEFEQFTVDTWCSTKRIGQTHLADQIAQLLWHLGSAAFSATLPSPIEPEALPMPSHQGFRAEDRDAANNLRPQSIKRSEDESVKICE